MRTTLLTPQKMSPWGLSFSALILFKATPDPE